MLVLLLLHAWLSLRPLSEGARPAQAKTAVHSTSLGPEMDPAGGCSADLGPEMDPGGQPCKR